MEPIHYFAGIDTGSVMLSIGHASNLDAIRHADTVRGNAQAATIKALTEVQALAASTEPVTPVQSLNPAQIKRAEMRQYARVRKHTALCATVSERSGWNPATSKGIDPETLALFGSADSPIDTVVTERIMTSPDGKAVIHATFVLRDDSYSARRRKGINTRKGINLTDGQNGNTYLVKPDGTRIKVNRNGQTAHNHTIQDFGF